MCDPATLATLAMVSSVASAGMATVGAVQGANAQKAQAQYQSKIAANNSIIAQQNADYEESRAADALARGRTEAAGIQRRVAALEGGQREGFAAGGVLVDTGSPLDTLADTNYLGKMDVHTALSNSGREAAGYYQNAATLKNDSAMSLASSSMYKNAASNISPIFAGASAAVSGAQQVGRAYQSGGF